MLSDIITEKLKTIKMLIMDVDGTMTDGGMYYSSDGDSLKKFHVRDGMGIVLLHKAGISTGIITSENSPIVQKRAEKLNINHIILGSRNKTQSITLMAEKAGFAPHEIAYIGDDINDIPCLQFAGFSAIPFDSPVLLTDIADYICKKKGGDGAIREVCELILTAQKKPLTLPEQW